MALSVGDTAPDFELYAKKAADGPKYRLSNALKHGGVVLQFFPLPFTGVCEEQMCAVRDSIDSYECVTVWGVTGHYPQLIEAWDRAHGFNVPILADYDHEVSRTYVGLYEDPMPQKLALCSKRSVLGISSDGVLRYSWISEISGVGPDQQVVDAAISCAKG